MEDYNSEEDSDYEPDETCSCNECQTIDDCSDCEECSTVEFSCPECLHLELAKDKLINQLAKYMTMYKQSIKKIKVLESKLKKK